MQDHASNAFARSALEILKRSHALGARGTRREGESVRRTNDGFHGLQHVLGLAGAVHAKPSEQCHFQRNQSRSVGPELTAWLISGATPEGPSTVGLVAEKSCGANVLRASDRSILSTRTRVL